MWFKFYSIKAGTSLEGRSVISPRPYLLADISIVCSHQLSSVKLEHGYISYMSASVSLAFLTGGNLHNIPRFLKVNRRSYNELILWCVLLHSQYWPLLTIEQLPKVLLLMQFCSVAQYDIFLRSCVSVLTVVEYIVASSWLIANNRDPPWCWPALGARSLK